MAHVRRILSSQTAEVQDTRETYQFLLDVGDRAQIVCKRQKAVVVDGAVISKEHSHEVVRKIASLPPRASVTLDSGKEITHAEIYEALEAFTDRWERQDEA
jgi:hypothetical protein